MNTLAVQLACASFLAVLATWVVYFARVPSGNVPARPVGSIFLQITGLALAIGAVGVQTQHGGLMQAGPLLGVVAPAGFAATMAALFLYLLTQRQTPVGELKVALGDQLLAFEATTALGTPFHSKDLLGQRTLLKFFRGGW